MSLWIRHFTVEAALYKDWRCWKEKVRKTLSHLAIQESLSCGEPRKLQLASGDMRKALCVCRSAFEMLGAELMGSACNLDLSSAANGFHGHRSPDCNLIKQNGDIVSDFMYH